MTTLGEMHAFGLLGAFLLSSSAFDVLRWLTHQRGFGFWIGIFTTAMVAVAWSVNVVTKQLATLFGGTFVVIGMALSIAWQEKWFGDFFHDFPGLAGIVQRLTSEAEQMVEQIPGAINLPQAEAIMPLHRSHTLVALRGRNADLISEGIALEKGRGGSAIYVLYVEERTGLFTGHASFHLHQEGIETLGFALQVAESEGFTLIPIWTISYYPHSTDNFLTY